MKWVALTAILATIPVLIVWLRRNPLAAPKIGILIGVLPFLLSEFHLYMAATSWEWPGYVKGIEFSILDAVALALYFSLPSSGQRLPFQSSMMLYFCAALLSAIQTEMPMSAIFYVWQLARMFLLYAVVVKASAIPRMVPAVLTGLAIGLLIEAGFGIWERFGAGIHQVGGTVGNQNLLGLISHLIVFPFFALLLTRRSGRLPVAVLLAGIVIEILTASRATIGLAGLAYGVIFLLSSLRQWSGKKAVVLLIALVAVAVIVPLAQSALELRGTDALNSSDDERVVFERAAAMMLSDHPMGVGANNYVLTANMGGYNFAAGVVPTLGSMSANVHNVYWLVAAETGYLGLGTFLLLLLRPLTVAFICGWRSRGDQRGDLLLGLGVALLAVYIHSLFEWIFVTFVAQYIYAIVVGLVVGVAQQLGFWRPVQAWKMAALAPVMSNQPARSLVQIGSSLRERRPSHVTAR